MFPPSPRTLISHKRYHLPRLFHKQQRGGIGPCVRRGQMKLSQNQRMTLADVGRMAPCVGCPGAPLPLTLQMQHTSAIRALSGQCATGSPFPLRGLRQTPPPMWGLDFLICDSGLMTKTFLGGGCENQTKSCENGERCYQVVDPQRLGSHVCSLLSHLVPLMGIIRAKVLHD